MSSSFIVLNVYRNYKAYQGRAKVGDEGDYILSLHCYHQNDSCIKMGSDESHFNVSLIMRDKVTRQCPQTATFEEKGEPERIRTEVPQLTSLTPYRWAKAAPVSQKKVSHDHYLLRAHSAAGSDCK